MHLCMIRGMEGGESGFCLLCGCGGSSGAGSPLPEPQLSTPSWHPEDFHNQTKEKKLENTNAGFLLSPEGRERGKEGRTEDGREEGVQGAGHRMKPRVSQKPSQAGCLSGKFAFMGPQGMWSCLKLQPGHMVSPWKAHTVCSTAF